MAYRGSRGIALPFMTTALEGGGGSASRPGRSLPPGKTRYPSYGRLGGPQGQSGQVRKISPPTGIRSPDHPARSQSLYRLSYPAHKALTAVLYKAKRSSHLPRFESCLSVPKPLSLDQKTLLPTHIALV